jgi:hypothetical protein
MLLANLLSFCLRALTYPATSKTYFPTSINPKTVSNVREF